MPPFIALPKYQASPLLDLSPIAQGIAQRDRALEAEARRAMQERQFAEQQRQFNLGNQRADQQLALSQAADARAAEMAPLQRQLVQAQTAAAQREPTTDDIREFEFARRSGFQGDFLTYQQEKAKRAAAAKGLGTVPIMGTGPDGRPAVLQLGQGQLVPAQAPEGYSVDPRGAIKVDTGTGTQIVTQGGRTVANIDRDIVGKERAEEIGKAAGKAAADLPRIVDNAVQALRTIEQIRTHPGRAFGTGAIGGSIPPVPGTAQAGFVDLVEQAKGKAFLEAFNSLRGGGQITEAEGRKATEAIARLNRARRPEDFEAALKDFEDVIRAGVARAQRSAQLGGQPSSGQPSAQPAQPLAPGTYNWTPNGIEPAR